MIWLADLLRTDRLQTTANYIDAGASSGRLQFWTSPRPVGGGAPMGTKLGEIVLPEPCGSVSGFTLSLFVPQECIAVAAGSIAWARLLDGAGVPAVDVDAGVSGSGADIEVTSLITFAGGTIRLISAIFT